MRKSISRLLMAAGFLQSIVWSSQMNALFGKTELELNGIGVIKEAAEILAGAINNFPSKSTIIAFLGLIIFSQGIFLLGKGLVNILSCSDDTHVNRRGRAQFLIGTLLTAIGIFATMYCANIAIFLMGQ